MLLQRSQTSTAKWKNKKPFQHRLPGTCCQRGYGAVDDHEPCSGLWVEYCQEPYLSAIFFGKRRNFLTSSVPKGTRPWKFCLQTSQFLHKAVASGHPAPAQLLPEHSDVGQIIRRLMASPTQSPQCCAGKSIKTEAMALAPPEQWI